jgi:hypothetical protein
VSDLQWALSELADIRAKVAASTNFRGIAPEANVLTGVLTLVVAAAQSIWPGVLAQDTLQYVAVWAGVLCASTAIVACEAIWRSHHLHGRMSNAMLGSALRQVLPFAAAGGVITFVICRYSPGTAWILPGFWQIMIGLFGFSVLLSVPRMLIWVAAWYFVCGAIVMELAATGGVLSPWMMGLPLAIGQGAVALIFYVTGRECDDPQ